MPVIGTVVDLEMTLVVVPTLGLVREHLAA
jgi:hypothetical protein